MDFSRYERGMKLDFSNLNFHLALDLKCYLIFEFMWCQIISNVLFSKKYII